MRFLKRKGRRGAKGLSVDDLIDAGWNKAAEQTLGVCC